MSSASAGQPVLPGISRHFPPVPGRHELERMYQQAPGDVPVDQNNAPFIA